MDIIHVVPGISDEASGPSYSVPALAAALRPHCTSVQLHTLQSKRLVNPKLTPLGKTFDSHFELKVHRGWNLAAQLCISPEMARALKSAAPVTHVMHSHSLWQMPNVYPAWATRGSRCRLVVSPRGTLSAWALRRSWLKKRVMWLLYQSRAAAIANCWHATSESEWREIRAMGIDSPVAVIPNGIHIPSLSRTDSEHQHRRLLFLGRIHPKKGIDLLLSAWSQVQSRFPNWELQISGPDEGGYLGEMQALAAELGLTRTYFTGPLYGAAKAQAYQQADLFVLPTHSENFGMAVAEALSYGVPAIVTHGAPWEGLRRHDCGWWIENSPTALVNCLQESLECTPDELRAKGLRGRAWMERDYSWEQIGSMMFDTYTWLLGGGTPPDWVHRG